MAVKISSYKIIFAFIFFVSVTFSSIAHPINAINTDKGVTDTTENYISSKYLSKDSAEKYSQWLLSNNPIFMDHWSNDITFVFDDVKFKDLPNQIVLPLVKGGEQFTLTWYGRMNSSYKKRWGKQHHGMDINLHTGDTVVSAFDGVVRYAQFNKSGFGNCVIVRHLNGLETIYGHLSKIDVEPNQFVYSGQPIGLGGSTGHSTGPHLHFETRYKDFSFDPELYIDITTQGLKSDTLVLTHESFPAYRYKADMQTEKPKPVVIADATIPAPVEHGNNITPAVTVNKAPDNIITSTTNKSPVVKNKSTVTTAGKTTAVTKSKSSKTNTAVSNKKSTPTPNTKKTNTVAKTSKTKPAVAGKEKNTNSKVAGKPSAQTKTSVNVKTKNNKTTVASKKTDAKKKTTTPTDDKKKEVKKTTGTKSKSYTIQAGDNLSVIAKKTGVSVQHLQKVNGIKQTKKLMPGQSLKIH